MEENIPSKKSFFKTGFGITLSIILSILGVITLVFGSFFFYYLYNQKYGSEETQKNITKRFDSSLTKITGQRGIPHINSDKNVSSYIRPFNPTLGPDTAAITIVTFIDFECPYSHKAFPIFENIIKKFNGTVRVVFKNFPIDKIHPNAKIAANYGSCVAKQGSDKFWKFYRLAFAAPELNSNTLNLLALQSGTKLEPFQQCLENTDIQNQSSQDLEDGVDLKVEGTPTYFVNQRLIQGVLSEDQWSEVIVEELQKKK
jgi:predicted DsbA family dithiol-disulfide isomerase